MKAICLMCFCLWLCLCDGTHAQVEKNKPKHLNGIVTKVRYEPNVFKQYRPAHNYGFKGGVNFTRLAFDNLSTFSNDIKPGIELCFIGNHNVWNRISARHEAGLAFKAFRSTLGGTNYNFSYLYLELPLLANYALTSKINILIGLQPSLFLYANRVPLPANPKPVSPVDISGDIGLEYFHSPEFLFGVRITKSLITTTDPEYEVPDFNTVRFYFAYVFHQPSEHDRKLMNVKPKKK